MENDISKRKDSHIEIAEKKDVKYSHGSGFSDIEFVHNALPEISLGEVDCSCEFLGKKLSIPLLISGMTGGTLQGLEINKKLAKAAESAKVAFGVGSIRPMLEDADAKKYYEIREACPSVPLLANIGAVQVKEHDAKKIIDSAKSIGADALAIHLNALQEVVQPEGETNFKGVLAGIKKLVELSSIPIIVKETGAGITSDVAKKLFDAGVEYVDVAGSGGTSWSKVEYERGGKLPGFGEWGFPTAAAVYEVSHLGKAIASGGIRCGLDIAKSIALGAKLAGAALPFLKSKEPEKLISSWKEQLVATMFLAGSANLEQLAQAQLLVNGKTADIISLRGGDIFELAMREKKEKKKKEKPHNHYL